MILIPEIQSVVILVPRTGSSTLRKAIKAKYPEAMQVYRHMEADGVPAGYDRWPKFGIVRDPLQRLWSLYKFLGIVSGRAKGSAYMERMRRQCSMTFNNWILHNEIPFTDPYDSKFGLDYYPMFNVLHSLPENRKSQFLYLRPDLGTLCYRYQDTKRLYTALGLPPAATYENETPGQRMPSLSDEALAYLQHAFAWDFKATREATA